MAVRTDVIGTEEQSEPTDVESVFLHVRTEPIGKIAHLPNRTDINCCGIPNCAILKCGCKAHHAQIRTTRENAYHEGEYAPRANAYHARECTTVHARECAPRARMRTTRENAHHA